MSDETPPPIRLKPRVRPPAESTPSPAAAGPAAGSAAPATPPAPPFFAPPITGETTVPGAPAAALEGGARLRLKAKLAAESEPAPLASAASSSTTPGTSPSPSAPSALPSAEPRIRMKPRLSPEKSAETPALVAPETSATSASPAAPMSRPPGLVDAEAAPAPAPPALFAPEASPPPPPLPDAAPAALSSGGFPPPAGDAPPRVSAPTPAGPPRPKVPHLRGPEQVEEKLQPKAPKPEHSRVFKTGIAGFGLVSFLLFAAASYYVYDRFFSPPPPAAAVAPPAPAAAAKAGGPAAPGAPAPQVGVASLPGQMINKAQEALNARRGSEQSRVDAVLEGRDSSGARALNTPAPGELAERLNGPAPTPVAPPTGPVTTLPPASALRFAGEIDASAEASVAFKRFVADARIAGVFQGQPPRALINSRTVKAGDTVDLALGIVFERVDVERKLVVFRDKSGATVFKKY